MSAQVSSIPLNSQLLAPKRRGSEIGRVSLQSENGPKRKQLERYISDKYLQAHNASISEFMPILLEMTGDETRQAALGLKPGQYRPMFLEQYLDSPIEQQVSVLSKRPIDRCSLVEIGNLVVTRRGAGLPLFVLSAVALYEAGYEWMVFTVTDEVERLMRRLGFEPDYLASADPARLKGDSANWGTYYDNSPKVMVGSLAKAAALVKSNPALSAVWENNHQDVMKIAGVLAEHRRLARG